ncbi:MAG: DnaD domain protein [Ruminococcaceae bacterium]|nr:DnaD domain protein [Oscillospiraceae bacterium]
MAEVKWIKVSTEMFSNNRKIKQIEVMPEGDAILVIWLKLLLLAGNINDGGAIYLTPEIPYTDEMLANELRRPLNTVRLALNTFQHFGMIEIVDDILHLSSWEKYQSTDKLAEIREQTRKRVAKCREKKLLSQGNATSNATVTLCNDIEEDKEEDQEKEYHSLSLSVCEEQKDASKRRYLGGDLGKGVVFLSDEQMSDLLDKLSIEEFDHYVSVVADCILKGKKYTKKTHYQAILDMAMADRKKAPDKTKNKQSTSDLERQIIESSRKRVSERIERN